MDKALSANTTILGQPGLNALQAIVSTNYLTMKFSIRHGVKEVRGDQVFARHCYTITLQGKKWPDPCPLDGPDAHDDLIKEWREPMDNLIAVSLNDWNEDHTI